MHMHTNVQKPHVHALHRVKSIYSVYEITHTPLCACLCACHMQSTCIIMCIIINTSTHSYAHTHIINPEYFVVFCKCMIVYKFHCYSVNNSLWCYFYADNFHSFFSLCASQVVVVWESVYTLYSPGMDSKSTHYIYSF